jgi:hypothetical protein
MWLSPYSLICCPTAQTTDDCLKYTDSFQDGQAILQKKNIPPPTKKITLKEFAGCATNL